MAMGTFAILWGIPGFCTLGLAQENWWRLGGATGVSWAEIANFSVMVDDSTAAGSLQPFELKPDENLLPQLRPWQRFRFTFDPVEQPGQPRLWQGHGNLLLTSRQENLGNFGLLYQANPEVLVDGDPTTYIERRDEVADHRGDPPSGSSFYYTIDIGARVPVERFVFYPPVGVSPASSQPFHPNYILNSFSLTARVDEGGIMEEEMKPDFRWRGRGFCCPLEHQLAYREANGDSITEVRFPLQTLRFLRLLEMPDGTNSDGEPIVVQSAYAEVEVFGRGFAPEATWESQIVDLGQEVNFGRVMFEVSKWRKDEDRLLTLEDGPVRVRVEIRTGRDDTPTAYFGFDDLGATMEVTRKQWERLTSFVPRQTLISSISRLEARGAAVPAVGLRGPVIEDLKNWSFWSTPLEESGVHPHLPRGRYLQLRIQLETDALFDFARLDSLQIEIAPLLADRVVGEIVVAEDRQPQGGQVRLPPGENTSFVYDLGVDFSTANRIGFDAVRVTAPATAKFHWLQIGDPLRTVEPDSIFIEEHGFVVFLPHRLSPRGDRRLRIGLETVLYGEAGEFGGEVFNREEPNILQWIEGGDVSAELGSNQLVVLANSSTGGALGALEIATRAFTPQGDGVNDELSIQYTLFRVQQACEVKIGVYALDGHRVWQVQPEAQAAGHHTTRWDGRDEIGRLVAPGIYLARVEVETENGSEIRLQPIAVVH